LTNTILAVKNTMDWITGDQDLLAISAKIIGDPNLKYASLQPDAIPVDASDDDLKRIEQEYKQARKRLQVRIQWVLTLLVPLLFAAYGLIRWRGRVSKRSDLKLA